MTQKIRCAIYTRKSSEEGLDQSFNSLDAQREACEAYVKSQRHEGWHALSAHYDDGGFSGGNMDRPALKRLMADIEAGKIDTVVVYKVDRLTRSLADFAKIIERFDAQKASFVSVTQQFNTTSSMGRLTLNVLLSFAQFEREVTGERIRDKIAASKKKGMWMGGYVPLGYDLRERQIYINPQEAKTVRTIFANYLRLGNVTDLKDYLDQQQILSKIRRSSTGVRTGGARFSRGALHKILRNHIYVGEIEHKDMVHQGRHEAIIDREQWNQVQKLLTDNRQGDRRKTRATKVSLFTGILFDADGNRYTPTHANKSGRRYRYYTSQAVIRRATAANIAPRIPAHDLEAAIATRVHQFLKSPKDLLKSLTSSSRPRRSDHYAAVLDMASEKAESWTKISARQREHFLHAIVERVVIHSGSVELKIRTRLLIQELSGKQVLREFGGAEIISLSCPYRHYSRGKALRIIIGDSQVPAAASSTAILNAIARVRLWRDQLVSGEARNVSDLARTHRVTPRYIRGLFRLASLSPASIELILSQQFKPDLTLDIPQIVRSRIEELVRLRKIRFICCTSTLLQGVNLPAKNIFVENPKGGKGRAMEPGDFWNLVGRAGRLTKEFTGNVFKVYTKAWDSDPTQGDRLVPIESAFQNAVEKNTRSLAFLCKEIPASSESDERWAEQAIASLYARFVSSGERLSERNLDEVNIEAALEIDSFCEQFRVSEQSLSDEHYQKNFYIHPKRLESLAKFLRAQPSIQSWIPLPPKNSRAYDRLLAIFQVLEDLFIQEGTRRHVYFAVLASLWMQGTPLRELVRDRLKRKNATGDVKKANDEIRELFEDLEERIRYIYVKYMGIYNSVLSEVLREKGFDDYESSLVPIHLFLEFGASSRTLINFMAIGLSRTSAILLQNSAKFREDMEISACREYLETTNLQYSPLPAICKSEIRRIRGR